MRARLVCNRYFPDPLGIVPAQQLAKLEFGELFIKNKFPILCNFGWHHLAKCFTITNKFFFTKMEKEKLSDFIVVSKLEFKFSLKIRKYRL